MVFLDGGVKLADVLTGARHDEVRCVEVRLHVESLRVDDAFEAKEKASPGFDRWLQLWSTEPR
eukprot:164205-Rhodomonas_salina.1